MTDQNTTDQQRPHETDHEPNHPGTDANANAGADPVDPNDVQGQPRSNGHGDGPANADQPDDEVTVDPADLTVTRDAEGQLTPESINAGSLGTIKVRPMAYGDVNELFGSGQQMDVGPETMADIFGRFIVDPDLDEFARQQGYEGLNAEYVKDMKPLVPRDLLMAVIEASGIDIDEMQMDPTETRAQMQVSGN